MRLPDFEAWAVFAKVAEFGSFTQAAAETRLSKPTISKMVSRLEQSLGVALFNRNSRHISLTETGRRLLGHARSMIMSAEAAEVEARDNVERPCGYIRMAAPVTFGICCLSHMLPDFMQAYPEIELSIHFSDSMTDLVAEGYDIALRIASLPDSSLRARQLCTVPLLLVAAQKFLDMVGPLEHPRDLESYKSFVYTNSTMPGTIYLHENHSDKKFSLAQTSSFFSDNAEAFLPALEAGLGFGLFPEFMVREGLESGKFKRILPTWEGPTLGLYLVTPPNSARPARVTEFMNYLVKAFSKSPCCTLKPRISGNKVAL